MKIDADTLAAMADAIAPLDTPETRDAYRSGRFPRADRVTDLDKRYRWDLLWASRFPVSPLYADGCNDSHIDTALRRIVPALGVGA